MSFEVTFGNQYTFSSSEINASNVCFLDDAHAVIVFNKTSSLNLTVVLATISGSGITYGDPTEIFETSTRAPRAVRLDNTHAFIAFADYTNAKGYALVATLSEGILTFGDQVQFTSPQPETLGVCAIDSTHAFIATVGKSVVATIANGDEVSFGSYAQFEAWASQEDAVLLDSTHVLVGFRDYYNSTQGTVFVATISNGNVVSNGTQYVFNDAATTNIKVAAISSTKALIAYRDDGNSGYGTAIIANIGTTITFGTEAVFAEAATTYIQAKYYSNEVRVYYCATNGYVKQATWDVDDAITFSDAIAFNTGAVYFTSVYTSSIGDMIVACLRGGNIGIATMGIIPQPEPEPEPEEETFKMISTMPKVNEDTSKRELRMQGWINKDAAVIAYGWGKADAGNSAGKLNGLIRVREYFTKRQGAT